MQFRATSSPANRRCGTGVTQAMLERLLRTGQWQRLARGIVLRGTGEATFVQRAWAGHELAGDPSAVGGAAALVTWHDRWPPLWRAVGGAAFSSGALSAHRSPIPNFFMDNQVEGGNGSVNSPDALGLSWSLIASSWGAGQSRL